MTNPVDNIKRKVKKNKLKLWKLAAGVGALFGVYQLGKTNGEANFKIDLFLGNDKESEHVGTTNISTK